MAEKNLHEGVAQFRRFNRFYTKQIGLLNKGLLKTRFPLIQARVLYELAQQDQTTASTLVGKLDIDPGYLSRILSAFEKKGLLRKVRSPSDSRLRILKLTAEGKKSFAVLNQRSIKEAQELLLGLAGEDRHRLLHAMQTIENILGTETKPPTPYLLRPHRALVAEILAEFIRKHDPKRECLWIAEQGGERIGSVMIVDAGDQVAQLRLLLVEPKARGQSVGTRLIDECINFSKRNRYQKIKLWTQGNLLEARHLYAKAGFEMVSESAHKSFGQDLIAEFWELPLGG